MPRAPYTLEGIPGNPPQLRAFGSMVNKIYQQMARIVNGLISFGDGANRDNIDGFWGIVADTGLANTNFSITHNLGRIPVGYFLMVSDKATSIYTGSVAWSTTTISLKSSVANAAIKVFII